MIALINLLAITLLISGGYGIKFIFDQKRDIEEAKIRQQELLASQQRKAKEIAQNAEKMQQEKVQEQKTNVHRNFSKLKSQNSDTVAWLYVPGTEIDLPIVKAEDNSYYLSHGFDKTYNSMGWAFADYKNTFPDLSTNTIMYGHTYKRTTIFSNLKNVLEDEWLGDKKKQKIILDTEEKRLIFQVFSVYTIEKTTDYLYINFSSIGDYKKYIDKSLKRSIKNFGVVPTTSDKILTISTCYIDENQRLVVQAKLIGSE